MNGLAQIERGMVLLQEAKTAIARSAPIEELKQIRDQSEALRALARKAGLQLEVVNMAAESKLRTERAIGDALKTGLAKRGRPIKGCTVQPLSELGIEKTESH